MYSWMSSGCGGTCCYWQRPHMYGIRDKSQTHSFLPFVSGVRLRDRGPYYFEQSTQNPSPLLNIFRIPGRIRYLIKRIVTDRVLASSYYLHAMCPLASSICSFFGESRGTILLEFFERITSHEYKEFTCLWSILSIFHQKLLVWKTWWPTSISSWCIKKKYVSNNDHFSVMKLMRELSGSWASSLQRQLQAEQEMQYFLGFACGPKTAFSRLVWY